MSTSHLADQVGRVLAGRYRLIAPVGTGASGQVYLAEDTVLHRQVAVKLLHPAFADDEVFLGRFSAEARNAAALNHPHIVAVHDSGEDGGPFLVTEFLGGGSLRSILDRHGRLTLSQTLLIGIEACRGLDHAHRAGLVHRDIKPANLLFDREGHLRIADFGLAKALAEASVTEPAGLVLGTARYASPEQARAERVGPASDVYALALVLVEAATGVVPFSGADTPLAVLMARTADDLPVPELLGPLRPALERAGALDPEARPDAGELRLRLLAAAESLPRPEPLPLVGPLDPSLGADADLDPTAIAVHPGATAPGTVGPAARAGTGGTAGEPPEVAAALAAGAVDDQPRRRRRWPMILVALLILLGAGVAGAFVVDGAQTEARPVPELAGQSVDDLATALDDFWVVERRNERRDGTVAGEILGTEPEVGVELAEGETLVLTVSLGEELRVVPGEIVGRPLREARGILETNRLVVGRVERTYDETAPAGQVLEILTAERELEPDSAVDLLVSDGPEPRPVPDTLIGAPYDDAAAAVETLGLVAARVEAYDNTVAAGLVIAVAPDPGTPLEVGGTVELTVSLGPEPVAIPDVTGLDVLAAAEVLRNAGLCRGDVAGPPDTPVITTDPPAGTVVDFGTCVRIVTTAFG